eukprot:COSAG05_NODE_311_length_11636_cov_11.922250_3_plen_128_part_00
MRFGYDEGDSQSCMRMRGWVQNARNASQMPHQCDFSLKYGEILLSMSVLLIFSSGIPALYWVGAVGFGVRYWVDKWFVLRICAKPPLYSSALIEDFDEILALVLLAHAVLGTYAIGVAGPHPIPVRS